MSSVIRPRTSSRSLTSCLVLVWFVSCSSPDPGADRTDAAALDLGVAAITDVDAGVDTGTRGCGRTGEPCCTDNQCNAGSACGMFGRCVVCGGTGLPCCNGNQCGSGSTCGAASICEARPPGR